MNDLKNQVKQARRRLIIQQFLSVVVWTMFSCLMVAAFAITVRKIWVLPTDGVVWQWSWIGGAVATGLVLGAVVTFVRRRGSLDAAIEIDQRYGLKERVSSCLALTPEEQDTAAGQALVNDAVRRVGQVDVRERFGVAPNRTAWLPIAAAGLIFGLTILSDAQPDPSNPAQAATVSTQKRVKTSTENLKKKLAERRKNALEKGLDDASDLFKKLEQGADNLANKNDVDRKKAMVKLNDLAKEINQRKTALGDREEMRKQLSKLKDLKQGPADRMAKAMKSGDFSAALDEVRKLQQKMERGELSKTEQEKLTQQLQQMKDRMQEIAEAHEQAKRELEKQIQQKLAQGDRESAGRLQRKLDQLNRKNQQMKKLSQMAQKMGDCAECMQQGKGKDAAAQLGQLADGLEQMQQEMDELEMLEDALDQIAQAKDAMNCENCDGMGCSMCQGDGFGNGMGQMPGMGLGEGRGQGDRPEEATEKGFYDSQVRAKPGKGKAIVSGIAFGKNKAGDTLEEIKGEIESLRQSDEDPLAGQRLPKAQRELARQYFNAFRDSE